MLLSAGTRIGGYEILGPLGAGGMGEVYRARDLKLGRDVAIKILPSAVATDAERLSRFEREARVLASLNHPHIGAIYGFDESGGQPALILELIEGDTLADRLRRGPIPVHEALAFARQIADALDAAHESGIIHRDLKPANIKVTPEGVVKVLDFGLAKALAPDPESEAARDLASSPTVTVGGTKFGVILGTAAYMSPEQARGKPLDKRTDLWAFGCVLFEMLSGRQAFAGETSSDVIAAILERAPDWNALPAATPATLRRVMERCLEKDPRRRLRDIGDARIQLDEIAATNSTEPAGGIPYRATGWWRAAAMTSIALLTAVAAVELVTRNRPVESRDPAGQTEATLLTGEGASSGAISPDGRAFVFVSDRGGSPDIWLRQIAGGEPVRVTNDSADESDLAFAPDGESVYFTRVDGTGTDIWRVGVLGGSARRIVNGGRAPSPAPDGRRLAYLHAVSGGNLTLSVSTVDGGDPHDVAREIRGGTQRAGWSADGRWLSYCRGGLFSPTNLFVFDVASSTERQVTRFARANQGVYGHSWFPDNRHMVVSYAPGSDSLPRTDLGVLDVEDGSIRRLTMAISDGLTLPSLSADGSRLIVTAERYLREIWKVPIGPDPDANGRRATRIHDSAGNPLWTSVSADARTLLFSSTLTGSRNLWTMPIDGSAAPRQITSVAGSAITHSSFSPDGQRVAFASSAAGRSDIWTQNVDGSNLRPLTNDEPADSWPVWSPDGHWIVFRSTHVDGRLETRRVPSNGGASEHFIDGYFRGDWVRQPGGLGTWIVTSDGPGLQLIDVEKRSIVWEEKVPGTSLSLPMFSPDRRSLTVPFQESRSHDAIWILDVATRQRRLAVRLPFHMNFRADWVDGGTSLVVNRSDRVTSVVLFDHFWINGQMP